jgi:dihydroorotate dehydrogenase
MRACCIPLLRQLLFTLDPETAHGSAWLASTPQGSRRHLPAGQAGAAGSGAVMGLDFPNPVGLAAGLDKNGEHIDALAALGFGFIEIGTVTPRPQPGNPRPRLFRIPERQAIINRMGFNNDGVDQLLANVDAADFPRQGGILGINIGKNFDTPIDKAADDYLFCLERVYAAASYVAVNISSPNTRNLRELQKDEALDALLGSLKSAQARLADRHGTVRAAGAEDRPGPRRRADPGDCRPAAPAPHGWRHRHQHHRCAQRRRRLPNAEQAGGLSGAPLFRMSTAVVRQLAAAWPANCRSSASAAS